MLVSMTGFGSASTSRSGYLFVSEIKAVNNRFLKTSIKLPDGFASLETKIDELLHANIARGSVYFSLRVTRDATESDFEISFPTLRRYLSEALRFQSENADLAGVELGSLIEFMRLPGVVRDKSDHDSRRLAETLWRHVEENIRIALTEMQKMRDAEGAATQKYLMDNIEQLRVLIGDVKRFAPMVVENYRTKLTERVSKVLQEAGHELDPSALLREVAIYTDRVDISEEIARFYSHLDQFVTAMENEKSCGKKLDFLTQEMFRETNTIGSKANSPDVLKCVVEMKTTIERIREMVQNVE